jgi:hypothetical protein
MAHPPRRIRPLVLAAVAAGIALFLAANGHLLYVALDARAECVEHLKAADDAPGTYRAAKSSC